MAGAIKQVATPRGVQVKEDARHDNDLFLKAGLEEVETVRDGVGETLEVQPAAGLLSSANARFPGGDLLTDRRWSRGRI